MLHIVTNYLTTPYVLGIIYVILKNNTMKTTKQTTAILEQLGLTKNEIKVYTTGLSIGPSKASKLAKHANLKRTQAYHILEKLQKKGLVSIGSKKGVKIYIMEPPSQLKNLVDKKEQELEKLRQNLDKAVTKLESKSIDTPNPTKVRFYEGLSGIENAMMNVIRESEEFFAMAPINTMITSLDIDFLNRFTEEREEKKIKSKSIWSRPPETTPFKPSKHRETRMPPEDMDEFTTTLIIYGDKVLSIPESEPPYAVLTESKSYAQTLRAMFNKIWKDSVEIS